MTNSKPILVIGATGKVGSRIARRLADAQLPHRAVSRATSPAFDWQEPTSWAPAMEGMHTAFVSFVPDLAMPGAADIIERFAATAKTSGLRKLVLLSGRGEHGAELSEDRLRNSGLDFTVIRASWFNQNFDEGLLQPAILAGKLQIAAGDKREPFVDANDIADVAVAALLDDGHNGKTYEVTGPRLMTFADAVREISAASGLSITYAPLSVEDYHAVMVSEFGKDLADLVASICDELFDGRNERLGDGVQQVLGRAPRDFSDYVRSAVASGAWQQAA